MNNYKLNNTIIKAIKKNKINAVSRKKYSIKLIRDLAEKYFINGVYEYHYCCNGEDSNCWVDVEGIDFGWMFLNHPEDEMPKVLLRLLTSMTKRYRTTLYKRKIFYIETNDTIVLIFPLRNVALKDIVVSFGKTKDVDASIF